MAVRINELFNRFILPNEILYEKHALRNPYEQ